LIVPLVHSGFFPEYMDALVLEIENRSDSPLCVGLRLSDNGNPPMVSSTGGREVLVPRVPARVSFPLESFASAGLQGPESKIRKIELLVRREHDCVRPVLLEVVVFRLSGLRRVRPPGPRLTEKGLEQVLIPDPDAVLGPRDLSPYAPGNPLMRVPPPVFCYSRDRASRVISGRILGEGVGFPPDWSAAPNGESEWRHFLHRHHFLRPLVRMLARTGDRKYLAALEKVVTDWITRNPAPLDSDGGSGPGWETLSTAFRVREWLWLMGAAWNRPGFDGRVKGLMLRSLWEHARHLSEYRGHPGNWRLLEAASLCLIGMLFPEFQDSATWRDQGLARLEEEASLQFFPDGMHFEISPLYHGLCVQACLEVFEAAHHAGVEAPSVIGAGLPQRFRTLAALYRPDFTRPSINDSGGFLDHERTLLRHAGAGLDLPEVLWTGSRGRRGRPPSEKTALFPDAGLAVVRSDYSDRGICVLFRAGPPGAAHMHEDSLSLEVSVLGRPVLVDPGISRYAPTPLTRSYRHAGSHSTILLGDDPPPARSVSFQDRIRSAKERIRHISRPGLEVVAGIREGGIATVTRAVALVAERFVVIRDSIAGTGEVDVRVHWQFAPGLKIRTDEEGGSRSAVFDSEKIMELVFLSGSLHCRVEQKEGQPDPPAGFVAHQGRDLPAPRLEYHFRVEAPIVFQWVLLPSDPGGEWNIAATGGSIIEFTPATGLGFSLDTIAWEITAAPGCRTSG